MRDVPPSLQAAVAARCISENTVNVRWLESLGLVHLELRMVIGGGRKYEEEAKLMSGAERIGWIT